MIKCFAIQSFAAAMILLAAGCTNERKEQFPKPLEYYTENAKPVKSEPLPAEYLIQHAFFSYRAAITFRKKMKKSSGKTSSCSTADSLQKIQTYWHQYCQSLSSKKTTIFFPTNLNVSQMLHAKMTALYLW